MAGDGAPGPDPFEGQQFDEAFIRAAPRQELSAAERQERAARLDADRRRLDDADRRPDDRRRSPSRRWPWGLAALVLVAGVVVIGRRNPGEPPTLGSEAAADVLAVDGKVVAYPPPPTGVSAEPLGEPPPAPAKPGPFTFVQVQPGTDEPVTWDPCRPILLVVNRRTAPAGAEGVVREAAAELSRATGLSIRVDGFTDEVPKRSRPAVLVERYGRRWAPVLVAWTDPDQVEDLAGTVAGLGGGQSVPVPGSDELSYVSGVVLLDGPQLAEVLAEANGRDKVISLVTHELAHLVGLGHVSDPTQLMYPAAQPGVTALRLGDLAGLAALGAGSCHPGL